MSEARINRPRRASLAGLAVALLFAAVATLGAHCTAAAETTSPVATAAVDGHRTHHGSDARAGHQPVADQITHRGGTAVVAMRMPGDQTGHHGGAAGMAFQPMVDQAARPGSPAESGSSGLIALCVCVAVAVLLALVRLGQPRAVEVRAPVKRLPASIASLVWPSPDPVRLCVLRT
ncbi:hypothetical protein [Actinokineospora xionganensis]|uniref:MYXO-CTERM domain-containing protein n=1 Tax=Actinokineospora xionganensis TaxID=2684470 RepID=A0ABR7LDY4_9PSEU|nr:hypothetical protein [Actinokineospora xionganensis]MBC6450885.1 hypothetical protein [Actinokineospora xionganensis]